MAGAFRQTVFVPAADWEFALSEGTIAGAYVWMERMLAICKEKAASLKWATGEMAETMYGDVLVEAGDIWGILIGGPPPLGFVIGGTDDHDINGSPYLAWHTEPRGGGDLVIINATQTPVHIPGHEPNPFVVDTMREVILEA